MRKQFTPDEWQTIKSQEGEWKQLEIFYRHWVSSLNLYFVYLICFEEKTVMRALANESFQENRFT